jgi:hypothetical protein
MNQKIPELEGMIGYMRGNHKDSRLSEDKSKEIIRGIL